MLARFWKITANFEKKSKFGFIVFIFTLLILGTEIRSLKNDNMMIFHFVIVRMMAVLLNMGMKVKVLFTMCTWKALCWGYPPTWHKCGVAFFLFFYFLVVPEIFLCPLEIWKLARNKILAINSFPGMDLWMGESPQGAV